MRGVHSLCEKCDFEDPALQEWISETTFKKPNETEPIIVRTTLESKIYCFGHSIAILSKYTQRCPHFAFELDSDVLFSTAGISHTVTMVKRNAALPFEILSLGRLHLNKTMLRSTDLDDQLHLIDQIRELNKITELGKPSQLPDIETIKSRR